MIKYLSLLNTDKNEVINEIARSGRVPTSMEEADIIVIPKKDKDPLDVGSYRPISLINTDAKLYARVLANRLKKIIPTIVHPRPGRVYAWQEHKTKFA